MLAECTRTDWFGEIAPLVINIYCERCDATHTTQMSFIVTTLDSDEVVTGYETDQYVVRPARFDDTKVILRRCDGVGVMQVAIVFAHIVFRRTFESIFVSEDRQTFFEIMMEREQSKR